jgi:hypothetical protein
MTEGHRAVYALFHMVGKNKKSPQRHREHREEIELKIEKLLGANFVF